MPSYVNNINTANGVHLSFHFCFKSICSTFFIKKFSVHCSISFRVLLKSPWRIHSKLYIQRAKNTEKSTIDSNEKLCLSHPSNPRCNIAGWAVCAGSRASWGVGDLVHKGRSDSEILESVRGIYVHSQGLVI